MKINPKIQCQHFLQFLLILLLCLTHLGLLFSGEKRKLIPRYNANISCSSCSFFCYVSPFQDYCPPERREKESAASCLSKRRETREKEIQKKCCFSFFQEKIKGKNIWWQRYFRNTFKASPLHYRIIYFPYYFAQTVSALCISGNKNKQTWSGKGKSQG